jgi:tetratricopeptide (TPR) repeat protein
LDGLKKYGEAEAVLRKAIALRPDYAEAYCNLGNALLGQQRHGEAEAAYRKAINLKPDFAFAFNNLGTALGEQGKHRESESALQTAIDLDPAYAGAHYNLGNTRMKQERWSEAEAAYRKAIDLKPGLNEAYYSLGTSLMKQARFDEAAASLKKASELLPAMNPGRGWAQQLEQQCQRYAALDAKLSAILRGTEKPANPAEQIEFAQLCHFKMLYAAAAHFYGDAFTAEPKLAADVRGGSRYNAACAAALAGCARGRDADGPDDKERARLRRQAIGWLRQDLTWWSKTVDNGSAETHAQVLQRLRHWQADDDLAVLRERGALDKLPPDERKECGALWSDVDALLERVREFK